jgi:putative membrane protein
MLLRWLLASLHLLALGLGLGAIWMRGQALRATLDTTGLQRVFTADNVWGLAALLWIVTGLLRAFGGLEKGTSYYLHQPVFWLKMALLACILLLEIRPMVTLIRWRILHARGQPLDLRGAATFARISRWQALLVLAMVFAATAMARGLRF